MDVTDDASVEAGVAAVLAAAGHLDSVVNNAGFGLAGAVEETTLAEVQAQLETNFFGVWRVCRSVLPILRQQGQGTIVNISSLAGLIGVPFQAAYSASKFALEGFSEALSAEVRPLGIQVVLVEPGDVATAFTQHRRRTAGTQARSVYHVRREEALARMEASEVGGPSAEVVAQVVGRILDARAPRLRYRVGPWVQRAAAVLKPVLPGRVFERVLLRAYGL